MRRFLYLSYYFPPSGGPGVQRTLKLSKYMPDFGWTPTVVTVDAGDAAYPSEDPTLLAEVPPELDVRRTRAWDPYAAYARLLGTEKKNVVTVGFAGEGDPNLKQRVARLVRANLFVPDARVGWVPYARRELARLARTGEYDLILSTGPPHSTHLAARSVAKKYDMPWVVEMRDPWTEIYYYEDLPMLAPARLLDRCFEQRVLREADVTVTVSDSMKARLGERGFPGAAVITNGFDPADFGAPGPEIEPGTVRHVGTLGPRQSLEALAAAVVGLPRAARDTLKMSFVGKVDPVVRRALQAVEALGMAEFDGVVVHTEAVRRMRAAAVLLLVIPRSPDSRAIITGKTFEYLAAGRPILGIGPADGDAARILRYTGAGEMFDWDDEPGIRKWLDDIMRRSSTGSRLPGPVPGRIEQYSRRALAERLARMFDQIVSVEAPRTPLPIVGPVRSAGTPT